MILSTELDRVTQQGTLAHCIMDNLNAEDEEEAHWRM